MKRLLALSIVLGSLLASCNAVPTSAGDKPFAKEDYAHLYFAGNDIYGMPVLYSDYSSLDRSSFADPDDVKEIEEIAFDQVFWERVYVASAEEPSVHVPSDGLGNDSSLAADSSLANEAVCQDSGDAEFTDPRKPTIDSENLDSFEGEAPGTLFAIHFDFWRSVKYAVYPATLYVYSYEAIR